MLNFYFDMDGVLAKFIAYKDVKTPPFMREGSHYFLHREPDTRALELFQRLYHMGNPVSQTKILTRVLKSDDGDDSESTISETLRQEWWTDKRAWLLSNTTGIDTSKCFMMSGKDKGEVLRDIPMHTRRYHILIDDFNPNLRNWEAAGGTAVKYINGLNSPESFNGLCLFKTWPVEQCMNALLALQVLA